MHYHEKTWYSMLAHHSRTAVKTKKSKCHQAIIPVHSCRLIEMHDLLVLQVRSSLSSEDTATPRSETHIACDSNKK